MNTTSTSTTTNVVMSLTEQNNAIISEALDGIIAEAVSHFNQKRTRHMPDDERYFFKKAEVDAVLSKLLHPEWIAVKIEYDVDGITPFCYTMDYGVVFPATRNCTTRRRKSTNI